MQVEVGQCDRAARLSNAGQGPDADRAVATENDHHALRL
jgi:hypothetical protein